VHLYHDHIVSKLKSALTVDLTHSDTLKAIWGEVQTQIIDMFKRSKLPESYRIRHPKTNKYYKNNYYKQVHPKRHQYDYHLGYSKHNNLDEQVMSPNKKKKTPLLTVIMTPGSLISRFVTWINSLSGTTCLIIKEYFA